MANFVYVATSLDGYLADKANKLDWLDEIPNPEKSDFGWADFMAKIDAVVMGANTFEVVIKFGFWPYTKPVFVLSHRLKTLPKEVAGKAFLEQGEVTELTQRLHRKGYQNLYIDGGKTIQSFLAADLIDELIITTVPILLGGGIRLFGELDCRLRFKHQHTEVINQTLVKSSYSRLAPPTS